MNIKTIISNNTYYQSIIHLASATVVSHIILFISLPIITRLYDPAMFGVLSLYMSIMGLLAVIASMKYELAIPIPLDNVTSYTLVILSIIILLIFSIFYIIFGTFIIYNNFIIDNYNLFILVLIGIIVTLIYNILTYANIRNENYKDISRTKVIRSVSLSSTQIIFGLFGFGYIGLIIGEIIGRVFGNLRLFNTIKIELIKNMKLITFNNIKSTAIEFQDYPKFTAPAWFMNNAVIHIIPIFIIYEYGLLIAGMYFIAYKIMSIPELILSQSINQAFNGKFSKMSRENDGDKYNFFISTVHKVFIFAVIITPLLSILSVYLFPYILGNKWSDAGELTVYLIPLFISQLTMSSMYISLNILNKQYIQFIWDSIRFSLFLILIYITAKYNITLEIFLIWLSILIALFYIALYIIIKNILIKEEYAI
jgi:O-antigen/teichoic acid export membrane protein